MYLDIVFKKNKVKKGNFAPYIGTNTNMQFQMYNKKIVNTKMDDMMARGEKLLKRYILESGRNGKI